MSFQYKIFPELKLKHGVEKTINDPVSITSNGNREIRRRINAVERYSWNIPSRNLLQADMEAMVQFFSDMSSSVDSFLYRDPTQGRLTNQQLVPFTVGGITYFALYHTGFHPVLNLSGSGQQNPYWHTFSSNATFSKNGVSQSPSNFIVKMNCDPVLDLGATNFQHPRTTVIKAATGTWLETDVVTYTGLLYKTVRFDSMLSYRISAMRKPTNAINDFQYGTCDVLPTVSEMADIKLMEVFEYKDSN